MEPDDDDARMDVDVDDVELPVKRFKHQSYNQSLKDVHLPSAFAQTHLKDDVADNDSHFHTALEHWRQLNLSPSFIAFANKAEPLSASLPLLLHNWREVYELWVDAFKASDDEGLRALLDLLQKMTHDLRTTLSPIYTPLLSSLLSLLPRSISPAALTALLETLSTLFRLLLIPSVSVSLSATATASASASASATTATTADTPSLAGDGASLLEDTYAALTATLPKCLGEIQRAVAEVWAGVLRRMKAASRERAVRLLVEDTNLEVIGDASAWVVVYACKSVSQTLHTCAPSILSPILSYHLHTSQNPRATHTLLRRALTALIHHVKNAEGFEVVGQVFIDSFHSLLKELKELKDGVHLSSQTNTNESKNDNDNPNLEAYKNHLDILSILLGVRQGSRLTPAQKHTLYGTLSELPIVPGARAQLVRYTTALFVAGEMGLWLGPGLRFLQRVWGLSSSQGSSSRPEESQDKGDEGKEGKGKEDKEDFDNTPLAYTLTLHLCLADASFGGWKLVALPVLLKSIWKPELGLVGGGNGAKGQQRRLIHFLGALQRGKKLGSSGGNGGGTGGGNGAGEVDVVLRRKVEGLVRERLEGGGWRVGGGEEAVAELEDILTLLPLCTTPQTYHLVTIINSHLSPPHQLNSAESPNTKHPSAEAKHTAKILGLCLTTLAKRDQSEWSAEVKPEEWVMKALQHWAWSGDVMGGVVGVVQASPNVQPLPLDTIYPYIQPLLSSPKRGLRLAALHLLTSPSLFSSSTDPQNPSDPSQPSSQSEIPQPPSEVPQRALQGELTPPTHAGIRERVLRIGRVGQVVGDEFGADVCVRWLLGQMKVGLRPLWSPAAGAVGGLVGGGGGGGGRWGEVVWGVVWEELREVLEVNRRRQNGGRQEHGQGGEEGEGNEAEEGDEEDPWEEERSWRDPSAHKLRSIVFVWDDPRRERRRRLKDQSPPEDRFDPQAYEHQLLVTLGECAGLAEKHNRELVPLFLSLCGQSSTSQSDSTPSPPSTHTPTATHLPLPKPTLLAWLTLFSKFSNPRALFSTTALHSLYLTFLAHPDRALQSLALTCLFTYKSPSLTPYEERFRALLDDTRWRDELAQLQVQMEEVPEEARTEVVEVWVRLLFGVMLERRGGKAKGGADRRAAVLSAFTALRDEELGLLVDLMLRPFGWDRSSPGSLSGPNGTFDVQSVASALEGVQDKQVVGFLTLLGDVMKQLGSRLRTYWPALLGMTVCLSAMAQRRIDGGGIVSEGMDVNGAESKESTQENEEVVLEDAEDVEDVEDTDNANTTAKNSPSTPTSSSKALRSIRQLGLKRLADFFRTPISISFPFAPYLPPIFRTLITPRLPLLARENSQSPSALLELFHTWTVDGVHLPLLVEYDNDVLPRVFDCLLVGSVKPAVVNRIFDIVENVLAASQEDAHTLEHILKPHVSHLLHALAALVSRTQSPSALSTPLGQRQIHILSALASFSHDAAQARTLLELFDPLLRRPGKVVPEKVKTGLVRIVGELVRLVPELRDPQSQAFKKTYGMLSGLFRSLRSRPARLALVETFQRLAELEGEAEGEGEGSSSPALGLKEVARLLESLNAYSPKRLDEPDFERRIAAFTELNERAYKSLSSAHWVPILQNMLNFIQDAEELAVRNSAAGALRRFIDLVAAEGSVQEQGQGQGQGQDGKREFKETFTKVLYPGLKNGLRLKSELVRAEVLSVLAYAVSKCPSIHPSLREMRVLLENGDAEANFFNNILHVQVHRRSRALRRLAEHCALGRLGSGVVAEVFVPLVGNFVVSPSTSTGTGKGKGGVDHHLVNDAIVATGRMARALEWRPYYALVQRYLGLSKGRGKEGKERDGKEGKEREAEERVYVRALVAVLDNFHFPMEDVVGDAPEPESEGVEEDGEADQEQEAAAAEQEAAAAAVASAKESQKIAKISDAVNLKLLPTLLAHLEKHDPQPHNDPTIPTDSHTRIPLAIGIVAVAQHLPPAPREAHIRRLITILSQILRAKSQETRDLTRDALNRIAVTLGPAYLPLIMRELRAALVRGPQLHVLAFVVHGLVVHVTSGEHAERFAVLDEIVNDVAHVSAEVIFGESGKDVQSEGFKTKMKEVRTSASKGLDAFSLVARFITPARISSLLAPIKAIMHETESARVMALVEEVLKRVATGLNGNRHLGESELLVLCNTLISQNARFLQQMPAKRKEREGVRNDHIVQMKRKVAADADHYASNSFRFVTFGLELLNTALKRSRFDFHDPAQLARLEAMVVTVGNTLYSTNASVLTLGMRCAAGLAKCPLKAVQKSLPVTIRQILDIIRQTGNTESELVQVAFKSLAVILRDGPPAQVKEKDLVYLLELVSPDLEEPTRQAAVFALLRAIVARKLVVPEIYDLMERVAEIAVTSQSTQVQELCRGVLLQFLLDYPQGKGRLRTQMAFLAKNLSYVYESGRVSVMELLGAVVAKFQAGLVQEYADLLFVALVMVVANDDSARCREMAAQLIKSLWARLDEERRDVLLSHLHTWAAQRAQPLLTWVSMQVYGFVVDVAQAESSPFVSAIFGDIKSSLQRSVTAINAFEDEGDANQMEVEVEWQLPYHSLTVLSKVLKVFPDLAKEDDKVDWPLVVDHLLFPHAWVRTAACRLLGVLFSAVPVAAPRTDLPDEHPLSRAGMQLTAKKLTQQLKSEHLDAALGLQVVKNLFYLGKCFYLLEPGDGAAASAAGEEAEDMADDDEGADDRQGAQEEKLKNLSNPLPWLFSKVSYQIRSAHIRRRNKPSSKANWSQQPLAGLRWFAAMASHMDSERLEQFLVHILNPVYRLTEEDTIHDSQMEELKTTAIELQDLVQSKVGTTKFANVYNQIRQSVLGVRRERKVARALQASTNPEAAAKRKIHRNVVKKDSRKRKERGFLEARGKIKRRREE